MRGKFDRHLYCCTDADLAVRSESALRPPTLFFFVHYPLVGGSQVRLARVFVNMDMSKTRSAAVLFF